MFAAAMIAHKFTMIVIKRLLNSLFLSITFKQLLLVSYVFIIIASNSLDNSLLKPSLLFFRAFMQMSVARCRDHQTKGSEYNVQCKFQTINFGKKVRIIHDWVNKVYIHEDHLGSCQGTSHHNQKKPITAQRLLSLKQINN